MRKFLLPLCLLSVLTINARRISLEEAQNAADAFFNSKGTHVLSPSTRSDSGNEAYYAFNAADKQGFVIISGDDRFSKVLGYSDRGSFDITNLPPQLKAMLDSFAENCAKSSNNSSTHPSWSATNSTRADEGVLLKTAEWNQWAPYNLRAPEFDGYRAPSGCVATALAIIMKYNEYPVKAVTPINHIWYSAGVQHSYDFGKMNLDYSLMKDKYEGDEQLSKEEEDAISEILYACAAIVNMQFGNGASSANIANRVKKLQTIFGFSNDCQYLSKMYFDPERWNDLIKSQLNNNLPVLYEGKSKNWIGHVFVIDGYDSEGLYHVNWGWGGYENGYFLLDELNSYSENQGMFINMVPADDLSAASNNYSRVWVDDGNTGDMAGYGKSLGLGISVSDIKQDSPFNAFVGVRNVPDKFHGKEALALIDPSGKIVEISQQSIKNLDCDVFDWMTENGLDVLCYGVGNWSGVVFENEIKDDYRLAYVTQENMEEWKLVSGTIDAPTSIPVKGNKPSTVELTYIIHGDKSKVKLTEPTEPLLYGTPLFHSIEVEDGIVAIYVNGVLDNFITSFRKQNDFQWMTGDKYVFDLYYMPYSGLIDKSYHVTSPGSLSSMISEEDRMKIGTIHISGDVNFQDIETAGDLPFLTCLDLENAHFVEEGSNRENFIPAYSLHNDDFRNERKHSPGYEKLILPKDLKGFEQLAVEPWNVDALDIPASVDTYVYGSLHGSPSFSSLGFVNVRNPKPVDLEGHNFLHSTKLMLFVPEGSKEAYSTHPDWSSLFYEIREVTPENPYIGEYVEEDNARYLILTDFAALVGFKGKAETDRIKDFVEYNGKKYPVKHTIYRKLNAPKNLIANAHTDLDWNQNIANNVFISDLSSLPVNPGWFYNTYIPGAMSERMEGYLTTELFSYTIDKNKGLIQILPSIQEIKIDEIIINGNKFPATEDGVYAYKTKADSDMPDVTINYTLFDKYKMSSTYQGEFNSSLPGSNIESSVEKIEAVDANLPVYIYNLEGKQLYYGLPERASLPTGIYILRQGNKARKLVIRN